MRDTFILVGLAAVALVLGSYILLYGRGTLSDTSLSAGTQNSSAAVDVPFTDLLQGTRSSVTGRVNYVITSKSQLEELLKMISTTDPMPNVDFSTHDIIAVFSGEKPTGGYAISVSKIADSVVRMVTITLASPGSACVLSQSTTDPYQIIAVPKTSLPLVHEDQTATTSCPQ